MKWYQSVKPEIAFGGKTEVLDTLPNLCIIELHAPVVRLRKSKIAS